MHQNLIIYIYFRIFHNEIKHKKTIYLNIFKKPNIGLRTCNYQALL